jgi:solute carrier family 25 folate transporter 32
MAGALTSAFTNPVWVLKTRMLSTSASTPGAYPTLAYGIRSIYRTDGIRGFYRGLLPSLLGTVHGAVQFMAYEKLKAVRAPRGGEHKMSNTDIVLLSTASKVVAVGTTYPYQVVRARLQTYDASEVYRSAADVVGQTWRKEGLGGFYRGLGPSLVRVLPNVCVTFLVYENVRAYLPGLLGAGLVGL